jgi:hypothetical protein
VEPCLVAVLVRRVRVSGSLALRGGAARQLRTCKAHVPNSRSECVVCSVTPRLLSICLGPRPFGPSALARPFSVWALGRRTSWPTLRAGTAPGPPPLSPNLNQRTKGSSPRSAASSSQPVVSSRLAHRPLQPPILLGCLTLQALPS